MVNGKYKTLQEGETSIFLCKPETFWLLQLQDRDFKSFQMWAQDVKVVRRSDIMHKKKQKNEHLGTFLALQKIETVM